LDKSVINYNLYKGFRTSLQSIGGQAHALSLGGFARGERPLRRDQTKGRGRRAGNPGEYRRQHKECDNILQD